MKGDTKQTLSPEHSPNKLVIHSEYIYKEAEFSQRYPATSSPPTFNMADWPIRLPAAYNIFMDDLSAYIKNPPLCPLPFEDLMSTFEFYTKDIISLYIEKDTFAFTRKMFTWYVIMIISLYYILNQALFT